MTMSASFSFSCSGSNFKDDLIATLSDNLASGSGTFPEMGSTFTDGSGPGQVNKWHRSLNTLAAGATQSFDLSGGLTDPFGTLLAFGTIRAVVVAIIAPNGTKALNVGPQGVANAWQGPFGGIASGCYLATKDYLFIGDGLASGWAVSANTGDLVPVSNPGAAAVQFMIWILGT